MPAKSLSQDRPRAHPPRKFTPDRISNMVASYEQQPFTKTARFAEEYDCSTQTVRNALHRAGIHHRKPAKKTNLNRGTKKARVRFARDYSDFDFSHAIFSDEKSFKSSQHSRQNVWLVNNSRYEPRNVDPNNDSGRIIVNMWGWMSAAGPEEPAHIDARSN